MVTRLAMLAIISVSLLSACIARHSPIPTPSATAPPATATPDLVSGPLTPYQGNPVFTVGAAGAWDGGAVFNPRVIVAGGVYHLFYSGSTDATLPTIAIGYAASPDGFEFTHRSAEPLLAGDGRGFDARQVSSGVPLHVEDQWVLYYSAGGGPGPGRAVGRATASDPTGPWERASQPVLVVGSPGEWDGSYIIPESVLFTDGKYVMYYTGGDTWPEGTPMIGMATSPDGVSWTKHGEPVLQPGASGEWDAAGVWGCSVLKTGDRWEMFYTGGDGKTVSIGYAVSSDGINWRKRTTGPILSPTEEQAVATPILQSPSAVWDGRAYLVYYDYGVSGAGIGLAMGNIQ